MQEIKLYREQIRILEMLKNDYTYKEIMSKLNVTRNGMDKHIRVLKKMFNVRNTYGLIFAYVKYLEL